MTASRIGTRGLPSEEEFRNLFSRHYGAVFAYAARRVGWDEAGDAAAEVFTIAWKKIRSVPDGSEALPWLYGVARRVVSNQRRSLQRRERLDAKVARLPERRVEHDPVDFDSALASLDDDDREVLMLAAWEGLNPEEMGRVFGCSANAASVRLHRARGRLAEAWGHESGGGR
ncbi:MAG: sigma-70 family RNA polymerase sigma factor [Acidimicrobiia bacterium]